MPRPTTAADPASSTPDWKNYVHAYRRTPGWLCSPWDSYFPLLDYGPSGGPQARQPSSTGHDHTLLGYLQAAKPSDAAELSRPATTAYQRTATYPYEREYTTEVRKAGINLTFPG